VRQAFLDHCSSTLVRVETSSIVVTPETVARWHQAGFHLYLKLISRVRKPVGRRRTSKEVQELIFQMVAENPTRGRRGYMGNSSRSALISPSERSLVG